MKKKLAGNIIAWLYGVAVVLTTTILFVRKILSEKQEGSKKFPICERCQKNQARIGIQRLTDGRREIQFLCQVCANETLSNIAV